MADTTVTVKSSSGWKVKVALGLGGLVAIVILAFLYRIEIGIIVLLIGSAGAFRVWVWAVRQHRLSEQEIRRLEAETKILEHQAETAKWEALTAHLKTHFIETGPGVFHVKRPDEEIEVKQFYPAVSASRDLIIDTPELPPPVRRLLDVTDWVHMLITGPTGVGKSTVACWLIEDRRAATVYVLDPHASQNARKGLIWPGDTIIVGDGRDWAAIDARLVELLGQMDARYKQPGPFSPILIISDEWLSVRENCEHANDFFETIGSEARKVDMQLVIMTVAATVDDLKCSAAVRDNLVQLRLDHALKAQNKGELKWGKGIVELVALPGPYTNRYLPPPRIEEEDDVPPLYEAPSPPIPPQEELDFIGLIDEGVSMRQAFIRVYGKDNPSTYDYDKMREIMAKYGRTLDSR